MADPLGLDGRGGCRFPGPLAQAIGIAGPLGRIRKPLRRQTPSIPNVTFVNIYFVLSAQLAKLILIRSFSMMLFLLLHKRQDSIKVRLADGKRTVTRLPRKRPRTSLILFGPFRRLRLNVLDQFRDRHRSRQTTNNMNVIDPATSKFWKAPSFLHLMTQHPEHLISKFGILKECATVLRAEHNGKRTPVP